MGNDSLCNGLSEADRETRGVDLHSARAVPQPDMQTPSQPGRTALGALCPVRGKYYISNMGSGGTGHREDTPISGKEGKLSRRTSGPPENCWVRTKKHGLEEPAGWGQLCVPRPRRQRHVEE
jgi:hypothetical protein